MNFKRVTFTVVFMLTIISICADYRESYQEYFFGRLPSARAEALGRSYVTVDDDIDTYFFNPAGIANIESSGINLTTSTPYYLIDKARYYHFGLCHNHNKIFSIGLNVNLMSYGEKTSIIDDSSFESDAKKTTSYLLNNSLTIATNLSDNISIGANINYFTENYTDDPHSTFYADTGIIYNRKIKSSYTKLNEVSFGFSLKNFSFSKVKYQSQNDELPVVSRMGVSYLFSPNFNNNFINILCQAEYKYLLNYDYRDGINSGLELQFYNILALRFGYYYENLDDKNIENNEDLLSEFTYGLGVKIPINKFIDCPLQLELDYTSLKQPSYNINYNDLDNFESISLKLVWIK